MLAGAWQAEGRPRARERLTLSPRLGSSRSLINTQRHFLLLSSTSLSPLQQSGVGALASPPTYGKQVARPTTWSAHSALSWSMLELTNPTERRAKAANKKWADEGAIETMREREREEEEDQRCVEYWEMGGGMSGGESGVLWCHAVWRMGKLKKVVGCGDWFRS